MQVDQLPAIAKLPPPVLTLYLNTASDNPSRHPRRPAGLDWLRKQAKVTAQSLSTRGAKAFERQIDRVEKYLQSRHPAEEALVIFAGSRCWKIVSLRHSVENHLTWGEPEIAQWIRLSNTIKAYAVVVIDHHAARFFVFSQGELTQIAERRFDVDVTQWKRKYLGHISSERHRKTRGSNLDLFEQRMEAQFDRLCREAAELAVTLCQQEGLAGIFLVGPNRLIRTIHARLPHPISNTSVLVPENLGSSSPLQLLRRLRSVIENYDQDRQRAKVEELFRAERGAVLGVDATLADLQKGMLHTLVIAHDLDFELHRCQQCGSASRSADPVCAACGGSLYKTSFRELLPKLALAHNAELQFVIGHAAELLLEREGVGGWFRQVAAASAR